MAEGGAPEGGRDGTGEDIRRFALPGLATAEFPFSHVVVDGIYAFLSGIVASDVPGGAAAHGDVAREEGLERTQDVSPAAPSADKKNAHFAPVCFRSARRIGTTTHLPSARRRSLTTK